MPTVSGAELVTRTLEANDIECVFNVAGNGIFPLIEAIHRSNLRYISGMNETAVSLAAEGYARATRAPAFLNLYHSSGTALGMAGLTVAWADHTPLIFTTTTNSRRLSQRDQYAAVPGSIVDLTDQYTKWGYEVPLAERIPDAIDRALTIATTPPMGPVHLAFPMDLYEDTIDERDVVQPSPRPTTHARSTADGIDDAASALVGADRPLIGAGSGVGQYRAMDALGRLAETLGAGIVTEAKRSYLPVPTDHPWYAGDIASRADLVETADVVLLVEFEFTELSVGELPLYASDHTLVQLTSNPADIGKQRAPEQALVGHPDPTLSALANQLDGAVDDATRRERRAVISEYAARTEAERADRQQYLRPDGIPTPMEAVVDAVPTTFGDELVVVNHAVSSSPFVEAIDLDDPDAYHAVSQKGSAQGWGMAAAVGVQLGLPERPVVAFVGDGGFMFTGPEPLYTARRHDIPVTVVVANDGGWGGGGYDFWVEGGEEGDLFVGDFSDYPIDYQAMCEAMSIHSQRVSEPDAAEAALVDARETAGPSVIEVMVDGDAVREYYQNR